MLELEEPSMLLPSDNAAWVRPEYSKGPFLFLGPLSIACCEGDEKFWPEYERRRGSKNGIENGLMLLMDVETFENAHYPR